MRIRPMRVAAAVDRPGAGWMVDAHLMAAGAVEVLLPKVRAEVGVHPTGEARVVAPHLMEAAEAVGPPTATARAVAHLRAVEEVAAIRAGEGAAALAGLVDPTNGREH